MVLCGVRAGAHARTWFPYVLAWRQPLWGIPEKSFPFKNWDNNGAPRIQSGRTITTAAMLCIHMLQCELQQLK